METKNAVVIGATGLVGNQLVETLLKDSRFEKVLLFSRRHSGYAHSKLKEHIVDFDKREEWEKLVKGDVLFSSLGTTIKQAGSKEDQYKVDHSYQYRFADAAAKNGVPVYVLVSSAGADVKSKVFYSRMKGELERDTKALGFKSVYFLQPSLLAGDRKKSRIDEKAGFAFLKIANTLGFLKKYKPVEATSVAKAMVNCSLIAQNGTHTITLDKVAEVAGI